MNPLEDDQPESAKLEAVGTSPQKAERIYQRGPRTRHYPASGWIEKISGNDFPKFYRWVQWLENGQRKMRAKRIYTKEQEQEIRKLIDRRVPAEQILGECDFKKPPRSKGKCSPSKRGERYR